MWQRGRSVIRRRRLAAPVQQVVHDATAKTTDGQDPTTREMVDRIMKSSLTERDLREAFYALPRKPEVVDIYVLHTIATRDDLKLFEAFFVKGRGATYQIPVNAPLGKRQYTALNQAAYHGAERITKVIISNGGDVHYTNSHGEDLLATLDSGEAAAVQARPADELFIRERFRRTRKFIEERREYLQRQAQRPPVSYKPRPPPKRIAARLVLQRWWRRRLRRLRRLRPQERP